MVILGDAAAIRDAARAIGRAGASMNEAGEDVRRHGRDITDDWVGTASDAAAATIETLGTRLFHGGDAAVDAEQVYLLYADALEQAQRDYAAGEAQAAFGRAGQQAAANNALRADAPAMDEQALARLDIARQAMRHATEEVAAGEAQMAAAVQGEQLANDAAADAIIALTARVDLMTMSAVVPATVPSRAAAMATLQDAVDALEEEPLAPAEVRLRDARAGTVDGVLDLTFGTVSDLSGVVPLPWSQWQADQFDLARDRLQDWAIGDADPESYAYQHADGQVHIASYLAGGAGLARVGVEGVGWLAAHGRRTLDEGGLTGDRGAVSIGGGPGDLTPEALAKLPWKDRLAAGAEKVPAEWGDGRPNAKKVGWRWQESGSGQDGVRIDQGDPNHPLESQRVDHVIINSGGRVLGPDGNPLPGDGSPKAHPQGHIPLEEWLEWKTWNSPE